MNAYPEEGPMHFDAAKQRRVRQYSLWVRWGFLVAWFIALKWPVAVATVLSLRFLDDAWGFFARRWRPLAWLLYACIVALCIAAAYATKWFMQPYAWYLRIPLFAWFGSGFTLTSGSVMRFFQALSLSGIPTHRRIIKLHRIESKRIHMQGGSSLSIYANYFARAAGGVVVPMLFGWSHQFVLTGVAWTYAWVNLSGATAFFCRISSPPACLVLAPTQKNSHRILGAVNLSNDLVGFLTVGLLHPSAAEQEIDNDVVNFRTLREEDWRDTVDTLVEIVPIVVLDTRLTTPAMLHETTRAMHPDNLHKVLFLTGPNGESPTLDAVKRDPSLPLMLINEENLLQTLAAIVKLAKWPTPQVRVPPPALI